jgi:methionyl-tRNA formyltransferase
MYYDRLFDLPFLKRVPTVNLHNSLLPRHRGVRPLEYALAEGDRNLGVTLHFVDEGIDTGPIIYQKSFRRTEGQTMGEIREKMMILGKELIVKALAEFPDLPQKVQSTREGCYHSKEDAIRDGFFSQSS